MKHYQIFLFLLFLCPVHLYPQIPLPVDETNVPFIANIEPGPQSTDQGYFTTSAFGESLTSAPFKVSQRSDGSLLVTIYGGKIMLMKRDGTVTEFAAIKDANCAIEGADGLTYIGLSTGKILKREASGSISTFYDLTTIHSGARVHALTQADNGDFYVVGSNYTVDRILADGSSSSQVNTGSLSYISDLEPSEDGGYYVSESLHSRASKLNADGTVISGFFTYAGQIPSFMVGKDKKYYALGRKNIIRIDPVTMSIEEEFGNLSMSIDMIQVCNGDFYVADNSSFYIHKIDKEFVLSIDEFTPDNTVVATVKAFDPNADAMQYQIRSGNTSGAFKINDSGDILVADQAKLDHDVTPSFLLEVVSSDGTNDSQIETLTINLNVVNTKAPVITSGQTFTVLEGASVGTVVGTVLANDPEGQSLQEWKIVSGNTSGTFGIDKNTGELTVNNNALLNGSSLSFNLEITVSDGTFTSNAESVEIALLLVNQAPSFTKGPDISVLEDCGPQTITSWATDISPGRSLENGQSVSFVLTEKAPWLFAVAPAIDENGILTFEPSPDANGIAQIDVVIKDDGGVNNGGQDASAQQSFSIEIKAVNDVPSFAISSNEISLPYGQTVYSHSNWAIEINPGAVNETTQQLTFYVSQDNAGLFDVAPTVDASGLLYFEVAPQAYGTANASIYLKDNGGTANSGIDQSANLPFKITVEPPPENPPVIAAGQAFDILEGSVAGTKVGVVNASDPDPNSTLQAWKIVGGNKSGIFTINDIGEITVLNGTALDGSITDFMLSIEVSDGLHTSKAENVTIHVLLINDPPSFTKGQDIEILEDAGSQEHPFWASDISAGSSAEAGQALQFIVTADDPSLFVQGPSIDAGGTLTYTPAADANGKSNISVMLMDDGGTLNGGQDSSLISNFIISITPVNDAPSFSMKSNIIELENGANDYQFKNWITSMSTGPVDEGSQHLVFHLTNYDEGLFSNTPTIDEAGTLSFSITANVAGQTTIAIQMMDDGGGAYGGIDHSEIQSLTIVVKKIPQIIELSHIDDQLAGHLPVEVIAIGGNSGNPVVLSIETSPAGGVAQLEDGKIFLDGPGVVTVNATQAGNELYADAEEVSITFRISQGDLFLPTLFSPNHDGNNDFFVLRGAYELDEVEFYVFDRNGIVVFHSNDINAITETGWDGNFQGSQQPIGNYTWKLSGHFKSGDRITVNGKNTGKVKLIR